MLTEMPDRTRAERADKWRQAEATVRTWVDGRGLDIDEKIIELIVALNCLGIHTYQSCGGHTGAKRMVMGYVDIGYKDSDRKVPTLRGHIRHNREIAFMAQMLLDDFDLGGLLILEPGPANSTCRLRGRPGRSAKLTRHNIEKASAQLVALGKFAKRQFLKGVRYRDLFEK